MSKNMVRIAFTGDIMSYPPQNDFCARGENIFDYSKVFEKVEKLLSENDYLVGNLETPLAGKEYEYSHAQYSFNTPLDFGRKIKGIGFDLVSTANNHCMDRGIDGLFATLNNLDSIGLNHIGTARSAAEREKSFIANIGKMKIGFLAYTYGTNAFAHHTFVPSDKQWAVNLFQPEETLSGSVHLLDSAETIAENVRKIWDDPEQFEKIEKPYLDRLKSDAARCRENGAEFVILIMHSGGQYNEFPEEFTGRVVSWIRNHCAIDAIVGHHPHIIQKFCMEGTLPVLYSLGNFAFTPGYNPGSTQFGAIFSIVPTLVLKRRDSKVMLDEISFRTVCNQVSKDGFATVSPVTDSFMEIESDEARAEFEKIHGECLCRLTGRTNPEPLRESYTLFKRKE